MGNESNEKDRRSQDRRSDDRRKGDRRKEGLEHVTFKAGDAIFNQGDSGNCAYIIQSGMVEIFRKFSDGRKQHIAELKQNSLLGEMSLIGGQPHSVSAVALNNCVLAKMTRDNFDNMCKHKPLGMLSILKTLVKRLGVTMDYVTKLEQQIQGTDSKE